MRGVSLSTALLLAAGSGLVHALPRVEDRAIPLAPLPTAAVPFPVLSPEDALSKLSSKAVASPTAVSLVPGVPLSIDHHGVVHDIAPTGLPPTDRPVEKRVENPMLKQRQQQEQQQQQPSPVEREVNQVRAACTNPTIVYEWRSLSAADQQGFTAAMKCLFSQPSRSGLPGCQSRWDDLTAIHQHMTPTIHDDGQFMPWHRYFMWIFEQELRNTCGYRGAMTWWDETKDAGNFNGAPMYTTQYLGHMPDGNNVCIISGQFAYTTLHIGPGPGNSNHCLARGVNEQISSQITSSYVSTCLSYNDFDQMQECIFLGVHGLGHNAIGGGVMNDVYSSPGDPAFFLHHGFVNRHWRIWQRTNPGPRTYAIDGYTTTPCEEHQQSSGCQTTGLNYQLSSLGFYPTITADQIMDTEGGFLCYHYDY